MGAIRKPAPVKLFMGLIARNKALMEKAERRLAEEFGAIDARSPYVPFDFTDYYEEEMGSSLQRRFFAFSKLIDPGKLAHIKVRTNELEVEIAATVPVQAGDTKDQSKLPRPINIDPGYITSSKVILGTTKEQSHRAYIGEGIYAESTLHFVSGDFVPWEYTYQDYATEEYREFFRTVRKLFLTQKKSQA